MNRPRDPHHGSDFLKIDFYPKLFKNLIEINRVERNNGSDDESRSETLRQFSRVPSPGE
jgi:hypothetical protein